MCDALNDLAEMFKFGPQTLSSAPEEFYRQVIAEFGERYASGKMAGKTKGIEAGYKMGAKDERERLAAQDTESN